MNENNKGKTEKPFSELTTEEMLIYMQNDAALPPDAQEYVSRVLQRIQARNTKSGPEVNGLNVFYPDITRDKRGEITDVRGFKKQDDGMER